MAIVDGAVEQIEDVAAEDRGQGHAAPVGAQTVHAESFGDEGWEAAEEEAVAETREAGYEGEEVRVLDRERGELRDEEDEGGEREAPEPRRFEDFDEEVGSYAWRGLVETSFWGGERDLPLVSRPMQLQMERMDTCMAWRFMMKSSVAESS